MHGTSLGQLHLLEVHSPAPCNVPDTAVLVLDTRDAVVHMRVIEVEPHIIAIHHETQLHPHTRLSPSGVHLQMARFLDAVQNRLMVGTGA